MVKRFLGTILIALAAIMACSDPQGFKRPEDPLDASREFVRAVLDGNYEKAEKYILPEEDDIALFQRYRNYMNKQPAEEKLNLKESNIIINKVEAESDSVSIVNFQNSWSNKPADLRVVRRNGEWYIDFKYTFSGKDIIE